MSVHGFYYEQEDGICRKPEEVDVSEIVIRPTQQEM